MKRFAFVLVFFLTACGSLACTPYNPPPVPPGPTPTPNPNPTPIPPQPPKPVDVIGDVKVGDDIDAVEKKIGMPYQTRTQVDPPYQEVRSYVILDKNGERAFLHLHVEGGKVTEVVPR